MQKWKLMLSTLPFVVGVTAVKLALTWGLDFHGAVEFGEIGLVLTGGVFLTGFLLAGTMADYKESERIPGEIAVTLETIEDVFIVAAQNHPELSITTLRQEVLNLTDAIFGWLVKKKTVVQAYDALSRMNEVVRSMERQGAHAAGAAIGHVLTVRKNVARIDVIGRTGFLPPAYALLELLLAMIIGLLMVAKFKSDLAMLVLVPFVTLVNLYMLRLIRDIDDPFDYNEDGSKRGAAEVDLFPVMEYRDRLKARIDRL